LEGTVYVIRMRVIWFLFRAMILHFNP
jgi:hypothetical protein